jgi:Tfp pilus assembly protein PilF
MAYHVRASAYDTKGEYDLAISDLNIAIEIDPRFAEAYNNRAVVYCHMKENDKAREDLNKAQSLGYQVDPKLLRHLRQSLGRNR